MRYFKQATQIKDGEIYYAVPSVNECAITKYFWWNGTYWTSELQSDFWEARSGAEAKYPDLVIQEISKLEVLIMVGRLPKPSGIDSMEHKNVSGAR